MSLEIISTTRGAKNKHPMALCRCDCGETRSVRQTSLRTGRVTRCAKCSRVVAGLNRRRPVQDETAIRKRLYEYKKNAAVKGIVFLMDDTVAISLMMGNCWYCGSPPTNPVPAKRRKSTVLLNGIDRLDHLAGYTTNNCVACCRQCNYAKRISSPDEFLRWARRLAEFQGWTKQ